jgi:hypothetical protein
MKIASRVGGNVYLGPSLERTRAPCSCHSAFETHMSSLSAICLERVLVSFGIFAKDGEGEGDGLVCKYTYKIGQDSAAKEDHVPSSGRVFDTDFKFL